MFFRIQWPICFWNAPRINGPGHSGGALERLFTLMFQGFVYNQIWEDPSVDLEALELQPHHRLLTIACGGCNILNYLAAAPPKSSPWTLIPIMSR